MPACDRGLPCLQVKQIHSLVEVSLRKIYDQRLCLILTLRRLRTHALDILLSSWLMQLSEALKKIWASKKTDFWWISTRNNSMSLTTSSQTRPWLWFNHWTLRESWMLMKPSKDVLKNRWKPNCLPIRPHRESQWLKSDVSSVRIVSKSCSDQLRSKQVIREASWLRLIAKIRRGLAYRFSKRQLESSTKKTLQRNRIRHRLITSMWRLKTVWSPRSSSVITLRVILSPEGQCLCLRELLIGKLVASTRPI